MNQAKLKAALFIVVFLLIVAVICTWLTSKDADEIASAVLPQTTAPVAIVTPSAATPSPASAVIPSVSTAPVQQPSKTPTATPTPTPAPTPVPTPVPTPEPTPVSTVEAFVGSSLGSGSFSSSTGALINIDANWSARTLSPSKAEVTVTVRLHSYSLQLQERYGGLNISLGDNYISLSTPAVDYSGRDELITTLGSYTFTLNLNEGEVATLPLAVEWAFGGVYHDVEIDSVECGGIVRLER